ncbi:hypothetical protein ACFOW1_07985 [Parasediminibacterium paludis]|uniref:Uncharacterized protein n=1 Tax=Parasediminibacterium paludis TaxID=908966 RepID=A0ABV8PXR8_9BACT
MTIIKNNHQKLVQLQIAFWLNLAMCVFTFSNAFKSFDTNILWKEIASSVAFIIFLITSIVILRKMRQQKLVSEKM